MSGGGYSLFFIHFCFPLDRQDIRLVCEIQANWLLFSLFLGAPRGCPYGSARQLSFLSVSPLSLPPPPPSPFDGASRRGIKLIVVHYIPMYRSYISLQVLLYVIIYSLETFFPFDQTIFVSPKISGVSSKSSRLNGKMPKHGGPPVVQSSFSSTHTPCASGHVDSST